MTAITLDELIELTEKYNKALLDQQRYIYKLADAQSSVETEKVRVVAEAQASGVINGGNEAARKIQVASVLEDSVGLSFLEAYAREIQMELDIQNIEVKTIETVLSLNKAWLYSQSGH